VPTRKRVKARRKRAFSVLVCFLKKRLLHFGFVGNKTLAAIGIRGFQFFFGAMARNSGYSRENRPGGSFRLFESGRIGEKDQN